MLLRFNRSRLISAKRKLQYLNMTKYIKSFVDCFFISLKRVGYFEYKSSKKSVSYYHETDQIGVVLLPEYFSTFLPMVRAKIMRTKIHRDTSKRIEKVGASVKCTNHARLICSTSIIRYVITPPGMTYRNPPIHDITIQDNAKGTECNLMYSGKLGDTQCSNQTSNFNRINISNFTKDFLYLLKRKYQLFIVCFNVVRLFESLQKFVWGEFSLIPVFKYLRYLFVLLRFYNFKEKHAQVCQCICATTVLSPGVSDIGIWIDIFSPAREKFEYANIEKQQYLANGSWMKRHIKT